MISLPRLRLALGIEPADQEHEDDALLEFLLAHAIADVELRTGHYFGVEQATSTVAKGLGTRNLWLNSIPVVTEYTEITVAEHAYPGADPLDIVEGAVDGFELRVEGGEAWLVRWGGGIWTKGAEYVVSFNRGYAVDALPLAIETLIIALVNRNYADLDGMKSESIGGYTYVKATDDEIASIEGAAETLAFYNRPVIA